MMNTKKIVGALAMLACTSGTVLATESAVVKVTGTIKPSACNISLMGGGTIDYGDISASSLKKDGLYQLENKTLDISVACDGYVKVALMGKDDKSESALGALGRVGESEGTMVSEGMSSNNGGFVAGLGVADGIKVGAYTMGLSHLTADGSSVVGITSQDKQNWYHRSGIVSVFSGDASNYISVTKADTLEVSPSLRASEFAEYTPIAFKTLTGKLNVQAYLNSASELSLSKEVKLDGQTTIELHYL